MNSVLTMSFNKFLESQNNNNLYLYHVPLNYYNGTDITTVTDLYMSTGQTTGICWWSLQVSPVVNALVKFVFTPAYELLWT